jgi:hypothetical protein
MNVALARIGLVVFGLVMTLGIGEAAARVYYKLAWDIDFFQALTIRRDSEFGWEGRVVFGDLNTHRRRLLVVGDSMTFGTGVLDADLYSSVLGRQLNMETFTYGGAGYGTLQEYMVVDHYLPIVRPALVLLQVSFNDFINNSFELERGSWLNNNLAIRPYLEAADLVTGQGERIRYRFPSSLGRAASQSRLMYWFAMDTSRVTATLAAKDVLYTVESDMTEQSGRAFRAFQKSLATTETIIGKMKSRLGSIPLVVFAADNGTGYWQAILQRQEVPFFDGVATAIEQAERQGSSVRPDGAHWDTRGHRIAGQTLAKWLAEQRMVVR